VRRVALIGLMALGSVLMWIGAPLAWLWIASQLSASSKPSMGPYAIVIFGILVSAAALGKALAYLDRTYARVTHAEPEERVQRAWLRSLRGARQAPRRRAVLDEVMLVSVVLAGLAFVAWFLFFAGSSLPGS
jgi:hypothetical protein